MRFVRDIPSSVCDSVDAGDVVPPFWWSRTEWSIGVSSRGCVI